ncbi:hypothetical protein SAMN04489725_1102 [Alicyclobacillus hesperidum]|uniref:RNase H type-1 domain-containing protein n=1 Tax=Alicyclobacillus hesperidum TaxID=89784 RepID=A0A1H2V5L3_9BACL|nr:hypothetical protein SAMN04489725_1102 [Alicyclobacillus hesperidum]
MKTHSQYSISDLERSIKSTVLQHQNYNSHTWMEVNHLLQSEETVSVYCDCSVINEGFHLGVCIVGVGTCRLYGASIITQFPQYTVLGEIHALRFAIGCVRDFLAAGGADKEIQSICVFSDVDHIEHLLRVNSKRAHESIRKSIRRLRRTVKHFNKQFTQYTLSVHYVGNPNKRNLYYRSAHRTARRIAGIRK